MSKRLGLGYGKACFVYGSFSHLIRDCDFHEKRVAKQVELNKSKNKVTCQRNDRPVWNNVQRLNHQNKFVPTTILTKTGRFTVNTARQKFSSQAASTSTVRKVNTARPIVNEIRPRNNVYKSHLPIRRPFNKTPALKAKFVNHKITTAGDKTDNPHQTLKRKGFVDSRCSRHMTRNKAYLLEYQDFIGGPVAFGGSKCQITRKGKIITGKLDFEDVYFVKELHHFNLFSVSQMCDKKNKVLFTDTECLVLSPDFKLPDENQVLLRVPRQKNMYSFNLENIVPSGGLACLIVKATVDESNKWHRRVLVTKPQNKTPYELITGKISIISYIRPFGCHVTILNTIDHLGKFKEKSDEEFLFGYSLNSKAFRVYNLETKKVEENLHINFLENKTNVTGKGPTWLFDLDYLTHLMNYQPVTAENKANKTIGPKEASNSEGTQDTIHAGNSETKAEHVQEYYKLPLWSSYTSTIKSSKAKNGDEKLIGDTGSKINEESVDQEDQAFLEELESLKRQEKEADDVAETLRKTFAKSIDNLLL
nr:ribonuclease H-like domain-containing protein [Tanacetum cinerariifolium]